MSKAASHSLMARLHRKMAEYMEGILDDAMRASSGDGADEDNPFVGMPLDAATMGAIRSFLKDNEITCDPAEKDNLEDLREKFSRASQLGRSTAAARILEEAEADDRPYN